VLEKLILRSHDSRKNAKTSHTCGALEGIRNMHELEAETA
jgi:hypothetical protein